MTVPDSTKQSYAEWLKRDYGAMIDELALDPRRTRFLKSRWLEQLQWLEKKATQARDRYYVLRTTTIVGAVLVPALVSVSFADDGLDAGVRVAAWVVSLVVAASAAIEQFFRFGERWRNYRRTAERLKTEWWLFYELAGGYGADGATHDMVFPSFSARVEELLQADVDFYLTEVVVEREKRDGGEP